MKEAEELAEKMLRAICDGTYNADPRKFFFIDKQVGSDYDTFVRIIADFLKERDEKAHG